MGFNWDNGTLNGDYCSGLKASDPSMQRTPTLGPKVCKYNVHWAIWIPSFQFFLKTALVIRLRSTPGIPTANTRSPGLNPEAPR